MCEHQELQDHVFRPPLDPRPNTFGNAFHEVGSDLIRSELGAYGERILESSTAYLQSNVCNIMTVEN